MAVLTLAAERSAVRAGVFGVVSDASAAGAEELHSLREQVRRAVLAPQRPCELALLVMKPSALMMKGLETARRHIQTK